MIEIKKFASKIRNHPVLRRQTVAQATILITAFLLLSKFIGYFREVLVAKYFGATGQTDAFLVALIIPTLIMGLVSSGLGTLIIPDYIEKSKKDDKKAKIFVNQIFFIWLIIITILSLIIYLFAPFFVKIFAYGFQGERLDLAIRLTRYLIPLGFATVFIGFFTGIFQSKKQFLYPTIISIIGNILIVLSLILFINKLGINSWMIGELALSIFCFFSLFLVLQERWHFFKSFNLKNFQTERIKKFLIIFFPLMLASGIRIINQIVDKAIASHLSIGSISILNFAQKTYAIPLTILVVPLITAIFPTFSSLAIDKNNRKHYAQILKKALSLSWSIIIPVSVIMMILAEPIVKFLFQRGAFTNIATQLTASTVIMYSIGLFAISANYFLIKIFYSFKDTKIPLILGAIVVSINIIGNIILSKIFGVVGIALATSIASIIGFILYHQVIKNKYFKNENFKIPIKKISKIILLSALMGILAFFLKPYLLSYSQSFLSFAFKFIISGLIFIIFYYFLALLLKIQEIRTIKNYFKKIIKNWQQL